MKHNDLTQGSIVKALLGFAFPVLGALFLQALYGAVDLIVVGKFATVADQSGVASGSMFTTTFAGVVTAFAIGITVVIGEAVGENNIAKAKSVLVTGIVLFLMISLLSMLIVIPLSEPIAKAMHAPSEALSKTTDYILVCGLGLGFIIFYNVLAAVFRGLGDSKTPLFTVIIACIVNILGDLFFVIVLKMGAKGAAIATVLAQAVSVLLCLFLIRGRDNEIHLCKDDFHFDAFLAKRLILLGLPVALQELMVGFSFIFIQSTVNTLGVIASGAVGIAEKVCAFLMLAASSYMQAMAAFAAQNNGSGDHDRAVKGLRVGIVTALAAGAFMSGLAFFEGDRILALFSNEPAVIAEAFLYLKAYAIDCLLTGVLFCFIGYYNGNEHTLFVMIQGIIGAFCVRVPLVSLLTALSGGNLFFIGLATPCSSLVQIILCLFAFYLFEKKVPLDHSKKYPQA